MVTKKPRYPIERDPSINWIVGPLHECVTFLAVEKAMGNVVARALEVLPLVPKLVKLAEPEIARKAGPAGVAHFRALTADHLDLSGWPERLSVDDFSLTNVHTLVSLWSAIEVLVENLVVITLVNDQATVEAAGREVKVPASGGLPSEAEARRIFKSLERKARSGRCVLEGCDWLLALCDIKRQPGSDVAQRFKEINELRNCILHRAGIADGRLSEAAPSLALQPGDAIRISRKQLDGYYDAMSTFAVETTRGAIKSRHVRSKEQLQSMAE